MRVSVFCVATNVYVDHWIRLIRSIDGALTGSADIQCIVFSDQVDKTLALGKDLKHVRILPIETGPMGWPEATLLRFRLISQVAARAEGEILAYLDADMIVSEPLAFPQLALQDATLLHVVRHPGYERTSAYRHHWIKHPRSAWDDLVLRARMGALGQWETRRVSRAYVQRSHRRMYVCGGFFFGARDPFLKATSLLAARVSEDSDRGVVARWHDESHLNWYVAHHRTVVHSSEYCYADPFGRRNDLVPRIIAVNKGSDRTR